MPMIKKLTDKEIEERIAAVMQPPVVEQSTDESRMLLNSLLGNTQETNA
jgi:hypothetical protein